MSEVGTNMRALKIVILAVVLGAWSLGAAQNPPAQPAQNPSPQPPTSAPTAQTLDQVVDRIIARENQMIQTLSQYTPVVETYIQNLRPDAELGTTPAGDKYFLGRAELGDDVAVRSMIDKHGGRRKHLLGSLGSMFSMSMQFLPRGFAQMAFMDTNGFDRQHYKFDYVRREFLGEVRCLVFDLTPLPKSGNGRFVGRAWVEDQDYTVVRFNGTYDGGSRSNFYFHFDSWRVNSGPSLWLPAMIYSEENEMKYSLMKKLHFKAQTRFWGYNLGHAGQEQELSRILVEAPTPVRDQSETANDATPVQAQRAWDRQAEDNVVERLQRIGLLAPHGDVDKVLETVVNNLEVTNNLDIQPEVRCRILLTSTLESFTIGHTIVLSRGLIDVLPDEASLAMMVAHELGHVVLGHRIDTSFAFNDRLLFPDEETLQRFAFRRDTSRPGRGGPPAPR